MCDVPDIDYPAPTAPAETIIAPTYADAAVQKAGTKERQRVAGLSSRDVRTSVLGLSDEANIKKEALGA